MIELFARHLPWPTDWTEVYGRIAPLILEIGFGGGHFLRDLAQSRPEANVLGVEISLPSIRRGRQKLKVSGLPNGRVVQTTAIYLLWACCQPASIAEVYINFPDPWPKPGQQHRRLINGRFLALLASRLLPGGKLEIATDHADYAAFITECLEQSPYFRSRLPTPFVTEDIDRLHTKYESLALAEGRVCYYYKWQRLNNFVFEKFELPEEIPMPHVIVRSPLNPNEIEARFNPHHVSHEGSHVNYIALFQSKKNRALLVETYVKEEPLSQRVGIMIRQREESSYVIGLSEIGFPRPTPGLQLAIGGLAHWLLSCHAQSELISHNLANRLI